MAGDSGQDQLLKNAAWYPIVAVGLATVAFIVIKTGRDGLFFGSARGVTQLPMALLWISLGNTLGAGLHLKAIDTWGARRARSGVLLFAAGAFGLLAPLVALPSQLAISVTFVGAPVMFAAVFSGAWLLAADLLERADLDTRRRAYTRIGASSMIGGIAGSLLAKGLAVLAPPAALIAVGAVLLLGGAVVTVVAHRRYPVLDVSLSSAVDALPPASLFAVVRRLAAQRLVRALLLVGAVVALVGQYVEFQFYAATALSGRATAQFFGSFYLALNGAALLLQFTAAPLAQSRFGVAGALLVLPSVLVTAAASVTAWTTLLTQAVLRVAEVSLKASVFRSAWEQTFVSVPREQRPVAKTLVDGIAARIAEVIGAGVLALWVARTPVERLRLDWLSWAILVGVFLWLAATVRLRRFSDLRSRLAGEAVIRIPDS